MNHIKYVSCETYNKRINMPELIILRIQFAGFGLCISNQCCTNSAMPMNQCNNGISYFLIRAFQLPVILISTTIVIKAHLQLIFKQKETKQEKRFKRYDIQDFSQSAISLRDLNNLPKLEPLKLTPCSVLGSIFESGLSIR